MGCADGSTCWSTAKLEKEEREGSLGDQLLSGDNCEAASCWWRFVSGKGYLVDPASGHMLISKIKPCMSKHSQTKVKPRIAHYNSHCLLDLINPTWITVVILELIHAPSSDLTG